LTNYFHDHLLFCAILADDLSVISALQAYILGWMIHSHTTKQHPFIGFFSWTTWASWYQKGKTSLDLNEARNDEALGWQWHQLDHMQTN